MSKLKIGLMFLFLIIFSTSVFSEGNCAATQVCGVNADSKYGYGLVEICGECHACGDHTDGVCPEDFAQNGVVASCKNCPDKNCLVNISGTVYLKSSNPEFGGISDIEIYSYYASAPYTGEYVTISGGNGYYEALVPSGNLVLLVKDDKYSSDAKKVSLIRGTNYVNMDIPVREASCNSDCTFGSLCSENCQGISGCLYEDVYYEGTLIATANQIAQKCNDYLKGVELELGRDEENIYEYDCCVGSLKVTPIPDPGEVDGSVDLALYSNIKTLRSTAIPVRLSNGKIYYVVFNVWNE